MQDHKLVQILKSFSKEEFTGFEKFAASPFHNGGRNYLPFIKILKKFYPDFNDNRLTKEKIFQKLYPGKECSDSLINTTISRVLNMAEKFLEYTAFTNKKASAKYDYITELLNRNLYNLAQKELENYSALLDLSDGITDEGIKERMDYEILNFQLSLRTDRSLETLESGIKLTEYHIRFNMMRLAYFIHSISANKIMYNARYENSIIVKYIESLNLKIFYDDLKKNSDKDELNEITMIYVLWILAITDSGNETFFFEMKDLAYKNIHRFHHHEKYNIFQAIEAICWIMAQEVNREKYDNQRLDIYKKRMEYRILSPDRKNMRLIMYRSMFVVFAEDADIDYTVKFTETCIPMLPEEHRENMQNYSMAYIFFKKKDYEKALEYNSKINFDMFAFKLDTRLLQLKAYYELGYFDEAYSLVDAHKHFISNNETVSEYYNEMHSNFLKFYTRILKMKAEGKKPEDNKLIKAIESTNNIPAKQFLAEKVKELG